MATARVRRGRGTQEFVAQWFAGMGWPSAKSRAASLPGQDVYDMPGLSCEVKATSDLDVRAALLQARLNKADLDDVPFVVWRRNGYGPERIEHWTVLMDLDEFTKLLTRAGING